MSTNCLFNLSYLNTVWSEGVKVYQYQLDKSENPKINTTITSSNQCIIGQKFICCVFEKSAWSDSLKDLIWKMYKVYANHLKISSPLTPQEILTDLADIFSYQLTINDNRKTLEQTLKTLAQKVFKENVADYFKQASKLQALIKKHVLEKVSTEHGFTVKTDYRFSMPLFTAEIRVVKLFSHVFNHYLEQEDYQAALRVLKRLYYTQMGIDCSLSFLIKTLQNNQTAFTARCLNALNHVACKHRPTLEAFQEFSNTQGREFKDQLLQLLPQVEKGMIKNLFMQTLKKQGSSYTI